MASTANPVWVRGRAVERRKRSLLLVCLNARMVECRLVLPRSQLQGERECRAEPSQREFLVPAWWAKAASLEPAPKLLNDVDYAENEKHVLSAVYGGTSFLKVEYDGERVTFEHCPVPFKPGTRG